MQRLDNRGYSPYNIDTLFAWLAQSGGSIMRKVTIMLVALLVVVMALPGCSLSLGGAKTEKKDFTNFTRLDVKDIFAVEIVQADSYSITITFDEDLRDYIDVAKEGETLRIHLSPRHAFTDFTLKKLTLKTKITMPALYELSLSGATKATLSGFKSTHDFRLLVSGASSLSTDKFEVSNADIEISGASKLGGTMKASDITSEVSGASQVELSGSGNSLALKASGASNLNLAYFTLNTATVDLTGASEVTLNAKDKLELVLNDASRLYFYGNPAITNVSISGASTIKHR
jgi:hypothetical protein